MNHDRLLSFLGICKRAGRLISGAETVTAAIHEGKAKLALYACDVSPNSLKGVIKAAQDHGVAAIELPRTKEEISFALGKHCGIVCTTDDGFAKKILDLINDSQGS
ncbi:MAG: ribosomal L7Ae/L30e/S12e/Gadd45 family protein [Ruminococcus sp.]|nr:ribosomal L7Ae/L30e/S12e/Gadd45 family protein [Ruminococcus sp.]